MKKIIMGLLCVAFIGTSNVHAEGTAGSGPNPFSDCGIGAALFPSTTWAAVTSNIIWDIGTTAVTSATASPETCNGKEAEVAKFIIENYDNLIEETARGNGEHLVTALNIMSCDTAEQSAIIPEIRNQMATEVGQSDYMQQNAVEKSNAYFQVISSATQGCAA